MRLLVAVFFCVMPAFVCAQSVSIETEFQTKIEKLISFNSSGFMKYIDYTLPVLKTLRGDVETKIRQIDKNRSSNYFFQITYVNRTKDSSVTTVASIESADIFEILKAISTLKNEIGNDFAIKPDFMRNQYTTDDGFQVGYTVNREKFQWYIKLKKNSDVSLTFEKIEFLEDAFNKARDKIREVRRQGN